MLKTFKIKAKKGSDQDYLLVGSASSFVLVGTKSDNACRAIKNKILMRRYLIRICVWIATTLELFT